MPRTRRDLQTLRTEIRTLLRETDAANSYWNDTLLNNLINEAIDYRHMQLCDAHEGWDTEIFTAPIVAGQVKYQVQEGMGRFKRILMVFTQGSQVLEVPLQRAERWSEPVFQTTVIGSNQGEVPTYRIVGDFIHLEPPPQPSGTVTLKIEIEVLPARLANNTDTLPLRYPIEIETLLIYDTAYNAMAIEGTQGNFSDSFVNHVGRMRQEYDASFREFIEVRSFGRVFATPFHVGD